MGGMKTSDRRRPIVARWMVKRAIGRPGVILTRWTVKALFMLFAVFVSALTIDARDAQALLYDVDFGSPPHTVGLPPVIGSGPAPRATVTDIRFGTPTVVAAHGALTDQPLLLDSFDNQGDQVAFQIDDLPISNFYCIQSDVLVSQADMNQDANLTFAFDTPSVRNIHFESDGEVRVFVSGGFSGVVGNYTIGSVVALKVEIDLINQSWRIALDGVEVMNESFGASTLEELRVTTPVVASPAHITGAIDNLTINEDVCGDRPCDRIGFENLTPGTQYQEGDVFASDGVIVTVGPFTFTPSTPCAGNTTSGFTQVDFGQQNACRTGNELEVNNVTLSFDFGATANDIMIYYGEYGGTVSLEINGDCRVVQDFPVLDGTGQGGVGITVDDSGGPGECGVIRLLGEVDELVIGGQELWIDALSYCLDCPSLQRSAFDDLVAGTTYNVGDAFISGTAGYTVGPFFPPGPACVNPTNNGFAQAQNGNLACGNLRELNLNNVNVRIDFGEPVEWLVLGYGEYGGNVNLTINGDCRNIDNFNQLNATDVGGVRVIVSDFDVSGQSCGTLYAVGPIEGFVIGGQELWIDNVRACAQATAGISDPPAAPGAAGGASLIRLEQNHPNPLNPSTTIAFELAEAAHARLTIYDVTGRAIRTLLDGMTVGGRHQVQWDGHDARGERVASGIYAYRLEAAGASQTRRMIILK
jgi:hypothetical protein